MKPIRIKMAHQLIVNYGLYRKMEVYEPHFANYNELTNLILTNRIYTNDLVEKESKKLFEDLNIDFKSCFSFIDKNKRY